MSIVIFSGPIRSGKTTALMNWCTARPSTSGILMPDIEGQRMFFDIERKLLFDAQVQKENEADTIAIGRFLFSNKGFQRANEILLAAQIDTSKTIVIDELGKLELQNKGFHPAALQLIKAFENNVEKLLLLVVRDNLVTSIVEHYSIIKYRLVAGLEELQEQVD